MGAIEYPGEATMRLLLAPGVGPRTLMRLREHFGSDDRITGASAAALMEIERIGPNNAQAIRRAIDEADPAAEISLLEHHGVSIVARGAAEYPPLLALIPDPPTALWVRGRLSNADHLAVAIVGSRRCTAYGREQSGRLAALLAGSGLTIVSGGALGVDGEAHRGALRAEGRTIVVAGCGLARCYPPEHATLFDRIAADCGAVISEYPMGTEPQAGHFPRRNRIISGLSLGVLVIEAARRSGALITARVAAEDHGREVMVLPGRVDSPASAGSLELLRDGGAALVLDHADVLRQLDAAGHGLRGVVRATQIDGHDPPTPERASLFDETLAPTQQAILRALEQAGDALGVDQLAARLERPLGPLMADVTLLQIRGRVRRDQRGISLAPRGDR